MTTAPTRPIRRARAIAPGSMDALQNVPPAALLPERIITLLTELHGLTRRRDVAGNEDADLRLQWNVYEHQAREEDAREAAEAARAGTVLTDSPRQRELRERRERVGTQVAALADAIGTVTNDLHTAMGEHRDKAGATTLKAARAKLDKAGAAFHAALSEAAQARGVADWLEGMPYDPSARMHILDLSPDTANAIGPALLDIPTIDGLTAITALTHITD